MAKMDESQRQELLKKYAGLRVTDVCDGMDAVGLQDMGLMDKEIRPLWRDTDRFAHRIYGFAHTVRFIPTPKRTPSFPSIDEYKQWKGQWYRNLAQGPREDEIRSGDVIVIDAAGIADCGCWRPARSEWSPTAAPGIRTSSSRSRCRSTPAA